MPPVRTERTLLARLVHERHWTVDDFVEDFNRAGCRSRPGRRDHVISRRQAVRWLSGGLRSLPHPASRQVLENMFSRDASDLFQPPDEVPPATGDAALTPGGLAPDHRPGDDTGISPVDADLEALWRADALAGAFEEVTRPLLTHPDRRRFLVLSGVTLTTAAHEWLVADPARLTAALRGKRIDAALVADLNSGTDLLRRLDDKLGGQAVYGMVDEQLRLVVNLLRNTSYSESDGRRLHAIAAELARLSGWTHYDAGHHGSAQRFYLVALRAAHEANAPGIAANVLRCMARQEADRGADPRTVVDLLRSAKAGSRGALTPTERAVISGALARAYACVGDKWSAQNAIDDAFRDIERSEPSADPPYIYWASYHTIAYYAGSAMLFAGDPDAAIPYLHSSIENVAVEYPRDLALYRAGLGTAYFRTGAPEAAVGLAHQTIEEASAVASEITRDLIADLCREMHDFGYPGATDLADHAHSVFYSHGE
jgi:tetratricopeptide (TPR) repeat protein